MSLINSYTNVHSNIQKYEYELSILKSLYDKHFHNEIFQDSWITVNDTLINLYKEKDRLMLIYAQAEAIDKKRASYAVTIGSSNNDIQELFDRFTRFSKSAYCKKTNITYFFEMANFLHIHFLVELQEGSANMLKRHGDIRKRHGIEKSTGKKTNFDIRFLKSPVDVLKWKNYISKDNTKDFSNINTHNIPLSGFIDTSVSE